MPPTTRNRECSRHQFFSESGGGPSSVYSLKTKIGALVFLARALSRILGMTFCAGNSIWTPTRVISRRWDLVSAIAGSKSANRIAPIERSASNFIQDHLKSDL